MAGPDFLVDCGRRLASTHRLTTGPARKCLLSRLQREPAALGDVHRALPGSSARTRHSSGRRMAVGQLWPDRRQHPHGSPAIARQGAKTLPLLLDGEHRGLPRIYDIATELIAHTDRPIDWDRLDQFFVAYQDVSPLTLAELWAAATMLRLALIEDLSRAAPRIVGRRQRGAGSAEADGQDHGVGARTAGDGVAGLRAVGFLDWRKFVEAQSTVERILREDPAGVYPRMDFASRDHYRHLVERLARAAP